MLYCGLFVFSWLCFRIHPHFTIIVLFLPDFIFCCSTHAPRPIKQFSGSAAAWSSDRVAWQPDMTGGHVASVYVCVCVCVFCGKAWIGKETIILLWSATKSQRQENAFTLRAYRLVSWCCSRDRIWIIKSKRMRLAGHIALMGKRNIWKFFVGKLEGKSPRGRHVVDGSWWNDGRAWAVVSTVVNRGIP